MTVRSYSGKSWEDLGDHVEDHRRDADEFETDEECPKCGCWSSEVGMCEVPPCALAAPIVGQKREGTA